jgi:hypothetical protein
MKLSSSDWTANLSIITKKARERTNGEFLVTENIIKKAHDLLHFPNGSLPVLLVRHIMREESESEYDIPACSVSLENFPVSTVLRVINSDSAAQLRYAYE